MRWEWCSLSDFTKGGKYQIAFRKAFEYFERNQAPKTDEQWQLAIDELEEFSPGIEKKLADLVFNEMSGGAKL